MRVISNINMLHEYLLTVIITLELVLYLHGMPRYAPASLGFTQLINRLNYYCCKYGYEEFKMLIYIVLLYHVTWPDDYLIYDIVTLTDILIT